MYIITTKKVLLSTAAYLSTWLAISQKQYDENLSPENIQYGLYYQAGPGVNNTLNWTYPYGSKLTMNAGTHRNFELLTTHYPEGNLMLRQWNPTDGVWSSWRSLLIADSNGNYGLGTLTPREKLEVEGRILATKSIDVSGLSNPKNGATINLAYDPILHKGLVRSRDWKNGIWKPIYYQAASHVFLDGKVGVGISEPKESLEVVGTFGFRGIKSSSLPDTYWKVYNNASNTANYGLQFKYGEDLKIRFTSNSFEFDGLLKSSEVKVQSNVWSDFVFEESYNLPTLQEVEKHIKEKGHLKDIPSAKEVEENGIYLGEMDAKLLQKIEELTLYVIELKKENIKQEDLIKQQSILLSKLNKELTKIKK